MSLPYFPFYGQDWIGDGHTRLMSLEERGAYIDLLCHSWKLGSIPADEGRRAHLLGITTRKLRTLWPALAPCWVSDGNGGLINRKQERVREKQIARQKRGKR